MSDVSPGSPSTDDAQQNASWQLKLLPWMILLPTVLIGVFIVQATLRMKKFEAFVYQQDRSIFEKAWIVHTIFTWNIIPCGR